MKWDRLLQIVISLIDKPSGPVFLFLNIFKSQKRLGMVLQTQSVQFQSS